MDLCKLEINLCTKVHVRVHVYMYISCLLIASVCIMMYSTYQTENQMQSVLLLQPLVDLELMYMYTYIHTQIFDIRTPVSTSINVCINTHVRLSKTDTPLER